jgi:hypothetical protein
MAFNTAHERRTIMHIVLKAEFFQRELGIKAGLPNLSCRFIQKINAGIRAAAKQRSTMFEVFRILDKLAVIALLVFSGGTC